MTKPTDRKNILSQNAMEYDWFFYVYADLDISSVAEDLLDSFPPYNRLIGMTANSQLRMQGPHPPALLSR